MDDKNQLLRSIPQVERLLQNPEITRFMSDIGRARVADVVRVIIGEFRDSVEKGERPDEAGIVPAIAAECRRIRRGRLQRVINGTGVIIHTNLGRSPVSGAVLKKMAAELSGYCNLEYDLAGRERGRRGGFAEELICQATGAEDAVIVNNNAASVFLILSEFARGREVIVSRGELIQIGGGFRIPDIMAQSGAILVEAGTTNVTVIDDIRAAATDRTAMIFSMHRSNFKIIGFTEEPSPAELAALRDELSERQGWPVLYVRDLGSGNLVDDDRLPRPFDPAVAAELGQGADLVCFSGDKLLGACQAGIIIGKKELVARVRKNPLMRILRADKFAYFILQEVLLEYINGGFENLPLWRALLSDAAVLSGRIGKFIRAMADPGKKSVVKRVPTRSVIGGGAMPGFEMESRGVRINIPGAAPDEVYAAFAATDPPVIGSIVDGHYTLDFSTIGDGEAATLARAADAVIALLTGRR